MTINDERVWSHYLYSLKGNGFKLLSLELDGAILARWLLFLFCLIALMLNGFLIMVLQLLISSCKANCNCPQHVVWNLTYVMQANQDRTCWTLSNFKIVDQNSQYFFDAYRVSCKRSKHIFETWATHICYCGSLAYLRIALYLNIVFIPNF